MHSTLVPNPWQKIGVAHYRPHPDLLWMRLKTVIDISQSNTIFVSSKTTTYIFMQAIGCKDVVLFALPNAFITNKQTKNMSKQNKDVAMGL